ncbi:MAG: SIMPL domain-containing protein [Bacteroidales bacterium]|nr:SIMPL domain-containing protein [Bacteroidales bacterium]
MEIKSHEVDIHLGLAALILGICIILAASRISNGTNTVTVKGLCEKEVMADRAIYPISYKESGDNLESLYNTVKQKNEVIRQYLKDKGFSDAEISIGTPRLTDRLADSYGTYQSRYTINSVVSLCTEKVEQVIALQGDLSSLLDQGIAIGSGNEWETPAVYEITKLNDLKPEMIEAANQNARATAEQFAKDSDSRLGKITEATQGLFSIEPRDANTPYIKKVRVVTTVSYKLK